MPTVESLLRAGIDELAAAGSESPRLDAELLLGHAVGLERTSLIAHPGAPVGPEAAERYEAWLRRRAGGEPIAYIRGVWEFHGLAFGVDPNVLIPRPETELLVDLAVGEIAARLSSSARPPGTPPLRVADAGTGSGAIAIAVAVALRKRRMGDEVSILATDDSAAALQVARENAVGHGVADRVRFLEADLLPPVAAPPFDVVLANLPYVRTSDIAGLPRPVSFEPRHALDGGADGLDVIRRLLGQLPARLAPDGVAFVEIGADQGEAIAAEIAQALDGWMFEVKRDLAGHPRVVRLDRAAARHRAGAEQGR